MSSALNSVLGGGDILGAALNIASVAFPPLGLATSVGNLVTQAVGQAVNQAAQQLCQESGMPKFLTDVIRDVVKDALGGLTKPSQPDCDEAAESNFGDQIGDLCNDFAKALADGANAIMNLGNDDECSGAKGGKKGGGSWLVAIAKAMGNAAGEHAKKLVDLSNQIEKLSGGSAEDAKKATGLQAEFQAESQMFGMLQSAFSNAIKSIGEGMSQMARKG